MSATDDLALIRAYLVGNTQACQTCRDIQPAWAGGDRAQAAVVV